MSTRQYIGARYVPKFVGQYDATQAYDALDVVDNGSGTTYIARIQTPPNTPLTDTTHWLVYGSSSGAILDLQSRVTSVENEIPPIKASILSIGGQADTNTTEINQIKPRLTAAENNISILKNRVKNCIIIGDSWGVDNGSQTGWITHLSNMLRADNIYRNAYGGSGFVATGTGVTNKKFLDLIQELESSITNKASIDTVIVCGGVNDSGQTSVSAAIRAFVDYVDTTYPNAQVFIGIINRNLAGSVNKYAYINDYSDTCGYKKKTLVYDMHMCAPFTEFKSDDTMHLTNDGYLGVARCIYGALFSVKVNRSGMRDKSFTYHSNDLNADVTVTFKQVNDNVQLYVPYTYKSITFTKTGTMHQLEFAKTSADVNVPFNPQMYYPTVLHLIDSNNNKHVVPGTILFGAGSFTISWLSPTGGNITYTNIAFLDTTGMLSVW